MTRPPTFYSAILLHLALLLSSASYPVWQNFVPLRPESAFYLHRAGITLGETGFLDYSTSLAASTVLGSMFDFDPNSLRACFLSGEEFRCKGRLQVKITRA